jgi:hypothetical protein
MSKYQPATVLTLAETVGRYREALLDAGFSSNAVEDMAIEWHRAYLKKTMRRQHSPKTRAGNRHAIGVAVQSLYESTD